MIKAGMLMKNFNCVVAHEEHRVHDFTILPDLELIMLAWLFRLFYANRLI